MQWAAQYSKKSLKQLHTLKEMKYKIYKKNLLKIKKTLQHGNIEINLNWLQ